MKRSRLHNNIIFLLVFITFALCAIGLLLVGFPALMTTTASAATPIYTMTYSYETYYLGVSDNKRTDISSGVTTNLENIGVTMFGSSHTSTTKTIEFNEAYFNFNEIYATMTRNSLTNHKYSRYSRIEIQLASSGACISYNTSAEESDDVPTLTVNQILPNGNYKIYADNYVSDLSRKAYLHLSLEIPFTIDTVAPGIDLTQQNGNYYGYHDNSVTVWYGDIHSPIASAVYSYSTTGSFPTSATTSFTSGTTFTAEGNYFVKVTDAAGNTSTEYFTIDKTAPVLTLSCGNGGFTNGAVSASWSTLSTYVTSQRSNSSDALTVKYSYSTTGSFPTSATTAYSAGTSLTTAGNYLMVISDKAGNSTSYTFTIDKTAPTLTLSCGDGGFTNISASASWSTTATSVTAQCSNSSDALTVKYSYSTTGSFPTSATTAYSAGTSLTTAGNYLMVISDRAGNKSSYTFTIDKTAPVLTLSCGNGGFTNGAVSASWSTTATSVTAQRSNSNDALTVKYSYSTTGSFPTSATTAYSAGTSLTTAGNYLMVISDKAGNKSSYTFTIDKTAPTLTLSCGDGGFTNVSASASWSTTATSVTAQCSSSSDVLTVKYSYSTTGSFPTSATTAYSAGTPLTTAGNYLMVISDRAGNKSSYTFTIDKTAPTLTLSTSNYSSLVNNRTNANVSASWSTTATSVTAQRSNSNDALTVKYSYSTTGSFPTSATTAYSAGTVLNTEGKYLITICDRANNVSKYYFEIYRQSPTFFILSESGAELYSEFNAFNVNIKLAFSTDMTAKLNSQIYTVGSLIEEEGEYTFILTDELGNRTTETIYIIKTPPTANFDKLKTPLNLWYETTDQNGQTFSFASFDTAYTVADARERALLKTGTWQDKEWDGNIAIAPDDIAIAAQGMSYYIYKSYNSASVNHAYFSLAALNLAIDKYASSSVVTKFSPGTPALEAEGEVVYRNIYYSKSAITFATIKNCNLYVDGTLQSYPYLLTASGLHSVREVDLAGNSISYQVIIDTDRPVVYATNLNGNICKALTYGEKAYFTYGIKVYLEDADDQALLKINDDYYIGGVVELRAAGIYTVAARDAAGNVGSLTIYISLIEPTISFTETEVSGVINSFDIAIKKNYTLNNILNLGIFKWNDDSGQWDTVTHDNSLYPVPISTSTLSYTFNVTGRYQIIIFDEFGRRLEEEYNFIKGSPKGTLATTSNEELPNGAYVRNSVYFTWATALNCRAEISCNGGATSTYERGTFITTEGVYTIKLISNTEDIYNLYTFTIDKTAPIGTLYANGEELKNGATTRYAVTLNWTESGCTATFNNQPYPSGTEISEEGTYTVVLTDKAGNKSTYTFRIKTTAPTMTIVAGSTKLLNYGTTKSDAYITWTENNCTCLVNGAPYTINSKIRIEGTYTVVLVDAYGNSATSFFTIDKTAPVGILEVDGKPVDDDNVYTNKNVALVWTEAYCTAVINRNFVYISGTQIKEDGTYSIVLSDAAGNTSTYSFTIKTAPPKATLFANTEEVSSGSATRYNVRLTWTESGCTATLNGEPYSKGTTISTEGAYTFIVTDSFGNFETWEITIDKTAPVISIVSDGVYLFDGDITRFDAYILWDDATAVASLNGSPISNGACIEDEGEFTLVVTDSVGNKSSQVFIIDKTAKLGTVISNTKILNDGDVTRYNVYFTWAESGCTATLNGQPYSKGTLIKEDGTYTVVLTDKAGNSTSYTFTIDKTAPVGILYDFVNETLIAVVGTAATSGSLVFTWDEEGCTATLNGEPYSSGAEVTQEGNYTFVLTDAAGNTSTYIGTIDKTAPELSAFTNDGGLLHSDAETRYNVYFTWAESGCTATLNGQPYSKGTLIKEDGTYTVVLTDAVGNAAILSITIYKLLPTADIIPIGEDYALPYLNNGFIIVWDEEGCTATLNGQPYSCGTEVTQEGEYQFVIINHVGSSSTYEIIVDRTDPIAQIFAADSSAEEITKDYSIKSIYFTWAESGCTATLNGEPYSKGKYLTTSGSYTFILTDKAGNRAIYEILISKDKPEITFVETDTEMEIRNGGSTTKEVQIITYDTEDIVTLNGEIFDTESRISAAGKYSFVVTNKYGNSAEFTLTIKDVATVQENSSNDFSSLFQGSAAGTVIFFSVLAALAVGLIVVPIIRNKINGGAFKKKLK